MIWIKYKYLSAHCLLRFLFLNANWGEGVRLLCLVCLPRKSPFCLWIIHFFYLFITISTIPIVCFITHSVLQPTNVQMSLNVAKEVGKKIPSTKTTHYSPRITKRIYFWTIDLTGRKNVHGMLWFCQFNWLSLNAFFD